MKTGKLCLTAAVLCCIVTAGCEQATKTTDVFGPYYMTTLKLSTSSDVVNTLAGKEDLVSQSQSVVASYGTAEKGSEVWFNMVAFDEEGSTAVRKYALLTDENAGAYLITPKRSLRLDAQALVPTAVLDEPYESDNARSIAILKMLRKNFDADVKQVSFDSADLRSAALTAMKGLNTVVQTLEDSPAKAAELKSAEGMEFDMMNIGLGRVRMLLNGDVATVKIKVGAAAEGFGTQPDVRNM